MTVYVPPSALSLSAGAVILLETNAADIVNAECK
jgi:membrane-bound ClpP family serine protease